VVPDTPDWRDDDYDLREETTTQTAMTTERLPVPQISKFMELPGEPVTDFRQWFAQFQRFLIMINAGRSEQAQLSAYQKNTYLMLMLGTEGARIFSANPVAAAIDTTSYDTFTKAVQDQFMPRISPYKAYNDFFTRSQGPAESADEYLTALRHLAAECTFGDQQETQIAVRLVVGCYNRDTKMKLLALDTVNLAQTRNILLADEAARRELGSFETPAPIRAVQKRQPRQQQQAAATNSRRQCRGCGSTQHTFKDPSCRALYTTCNFCKVSGHFERVCIKKQKSTEPGRQDQRQDRRQFPQRRNQTNK